jgi:hypothetical protein
MAQSKYGRNAFTVQESVNMESFYTYKCEVLTLSGTTPQTTASWDSPAKEVIIYTGAAADDDGITITLKVNGAHGADIVVSHDYLPFQVKGLLIEEVTIHGDGTGTDNDALTVLSFH